MLSPKYYDHHHSRPIDLDKDGCAFQDWRRLFGKALFARHRKGFLVFLPPHKIEACDEYQESDPYTVAVNIDSAFHKIRIECTLEVLGDALKRIQGMPKILDLGCGEGHVTAEIKAAYVDAEVSALDYSISAIEYGVAHYPGIDFILADAHDPPYAPGYFDVVVCNNIWEHVPDPLFLLSRASEIIRPGGYLVVSTPSRYRLRNMVRVMRGRPVELMSKHHVTDYSVGQVVEQLRYGGFRVVRLLSKSASAMGLGAKVIKMLLSGIIALTGSHHRLESTVFYLAQRTDMNTEQGTAGSG